EASSEARAVQRQATSWHSGSRLVTQREPETSCQRITEPAEAAGIRDVLKIRLERDVLVHHDEVRELDDRLVPAGAPVGMDVRVAEPRVGKADAGDVRRS